MAQEVSSDVSVSAYHIIIIIGRKWAVWETTTVGRRTEWAVVLEGPFWKTVFFGNVLAPSFFPSSHPPFSYRTSSFSLLSVVHRSVLTGSDE